MTSLSPGLSLVDEPTVQDGGETLRSVHLEHSAGSTSSHAAVRSWVEPGGTGETHSGKPVEARLRWVRDIAFAEHHSQIRTGNGPHNMWPVGRGACAPAGGTATSVVRRRL